MNHFSLALSFIFLWLLLIFYFILRSHVFSHFFFWICTFYISRIAIPSYSYYEPTLLVVMGQSTFSCSGESLVIYKSTIPEVRGEFNTYSNLFYAPPLSSLVLKYWELGFFVWLVLVFFFIFFFCFLFSCPALFCFAFCRLVEDRESGMSDAWT